MQERKSFNQETRGMSLDGFCTYVKIGIKNILGGNYTVFVEKVYKNNVCLQGLHILEKGSQLAPVIFLDGYYYRYREELNTIEELERQILKCYYDNKPCGQLKVDATLFTDWDKVKNKICYKLIGVEQNRELLKTIPHMEFQDLAIVFYYLLGNVNGEQATILVNNLHMEIWNKNVNDLYAMAKINTPYLMPYELASIEEVIAQFMGVPVEEVLSEFPKEMFLEMYTLTNAVKINGAACMLYEGLLKSIAERLGSDLIIIPSSIHELLIMKDDGRMDKTYIRLMVMEVNEKEVALDEVLSDNVYRYIRKLDKVVM